MAELKPCPFCGGIALYVEERAFAGLSKIDIFLAVRCTECGCRTKGVKVNGVESSDERKAMAAVEWNRRAEDGTTKD